MLKIKFEKEIKLLLKKLDRIPDEFFVRTDGGKYEVLWFMDRQKPSVEQSYDFDEERFGVTKDKKIIWGFDSGCSCPSPWSKEDHGDDNYNVKTWKEFVVESKTKESEGEKESWESNWFDKNWEDECYKTLKDYTLLIKEDINPLKVLKISNMEVRRFLMKRIGYDKIKDDASVKVIHQDGTSELLDINGDKYVKVRDSSTQREYLLYVPEHIKECKQGIAWTFDLTEKEYNPIIQS